MMILLKKYYFTLQVKFLIIFKPTLLFEKINQLDWYKHTLRQWIDEQNLANNSKILEVGCATGTLTTYIAQSGCIPTGVDFSSKMIQLAKINHPDIDFSVANILDLPFASASFDAVIAASLLNIVSDKSKAIYELSRSCKKDGIITILVPAAKFNNDNLQTLQASIEHSGFSIAVLNAWHNLAPKMKSSEIIQLFKVAGLIEIRTKHYLQGMVIAVSARKYNYQG